MADESDSFLLAVKKMIMAYPASSSPRSHTQEEQEHQGLPGRTGAQECRDNSNPSHESTQSVEVPGGSVPQEVHERKEKEEKEKQILLCKRNVDDDGNFIKVELQDDGFSGVYHHCRYYTLTEYLAR